MVCRPYQSHNSSPFKTLSPVKLVGEAAQRNHRHQNCQRVKRRPEHFASRREKTFPCPPYAKLATIPVQEKTVTTVDDVTVREHEVLEEMVICNKIVTPIKEKYGQEVVCFQTFMIFEILKLFDE